MSYRFLAGTLVVVILVTGCNSILPDQPAGVPAASEDAQMPGPAPESATLVPTAGPVENAGTEPAISPEIVEPSFTVDIHCTETDPHPIAQGIAETYHTTYEEVMTFFCSGVGFEDIVLGYQTAKLSGRDVQEVLTLWYDFGSWEDVWQELDLE